MPGNLEFSASHLAIFSCEALFLLSCSPTAVWKVTTGWFFFQAATSAGDSALR